MTAFRSDESAADFIRRVAKRSGVSVGDMVSEMERWSATFDNSRDRGRVPDSYVETHRDSCLRVAAILRAAP